MILYMILSLSLYFIYWIYKINVKIEKILDSCPDSKRCFAILFVIPLSWATIYLLLKKFIFFEYFQPLEIANYVMWSIIVFLSLQYIYEFCIAFGKITTTNGLVWYLFLYPGYFAIILFFLNFYYTLPLIFFPIITIPAMQASLNKKANLCYVKKQELYFNQDLYKGNS